jgi:TonB family protein
MSAQLLWSDLLAYSLQLAALVALAGILPPLLRIHIPRARLLFWQLLLAACLLLPAVQPFRREVVMVTMSADSGPAPYLPVPPLRRGLPLAECALGLVALGIVLRGGWLGLGLLRLSRYRRQARDLEPVSPGIADLRAALAPRARLCISPEVSSPVTFGALRPVVLLPERFHSFDPRTAEAIACHELLHVARRDWLFTVAEEVIRAVFWFHPAVWWLLGELQLSREQAVDGEVIALTQSRSEYVDALLAIAGAASRLDLAPAPLFLRKRHLKKRVVSILKERSMSKARFYSSLVIAAGVLAAGCWLVTLPFPIEAAPQVIADGDGVAVDAGAEVAHRAGVAYPETARAKGVQGTVVVEATVDDQGAVTDARVLAGPGELRASALSSVLLWHFTKSGGAGVRQVTITYRLPKINTPAAGAGKPAVVPVVPRADQEGNVLRKIDIIGLAPGAAQELMARLPAHEGETVSKDLVQRAAEAARSFDEHLYVWLGGSGTAGESVLRISLLPSQQPDAAGRLRVGGNAQQSKLISQARPVYPPEAKQARIQGQVRLQAVIGADGKIINLQVISGEPVLADSALEAVRQWVYAPTLLNGKPVEVITDIDVNYTLAK